MTPKRGPHLGYRPKNRVIIGLYYPITLDFFYTVLNICSVATKNQGHKFGRLIGLYDPKTRSKPTPTPKRGKKLGWNTLNHG
jgi:hypothetical protein